MIKTIIFDVGGVLTKGHLDEFFSRASDLLNIDRRIEMDKDSWTEMQKGRTSLQDTLRKIFNVEISDEKMERLLQIWEQTWKLNHEMIGLAKSLKTNYKIAMLTNVDKVSVDRYRNYHHFDFIEHKFRSFELGMVKPEREIYEHLLKETGSNPEECIFIDDKIENVEAAKRLGIKGVVFRNKRQLEKDLKEMGVRLE